MSEGTSGETERGAVVTTLSGKRIDGSMRVASTDRVSFSYSRNGQCGLVAGERIDVASDHGTRFKGEVVNTTHLGHIQVCTVTVVEILSGPALSVTRERRATVRVRLPSHTSVRVATELEPDGTLSRPMIGRLIDVSLGGCRIETSRADAVRCGSSMTLWVEFELSDEPLQLEIEVLNTFLPSNGNLAMGCRWRRSPNDDAAFDVLGRFVRQTRSGRVPANAGKA